MLDDCERLVNQMENLSQVPGVNPRGIMKPICPDPDLILPQGIVGNSSSFRACLQLLGKAARCDTTVLITGETGTGKECFAKLLHEASSRRTGPFVAVNCGALPDNLVEAELFGHARGAFTGAVSDRTGKFVLAHGGTLFLDEIGEMPPVAQTRLLRALQERVVEPVGGQPVAVDIRLVAATHRNLQDDVRVGRFREDLWFRLNVVHVHIPPLRERREDIVPLARHFFDRFNALYGADGILTPAHESLLRAYAWPGNVRELANVMERAVVLADSGGLALWLEEPYVRSAGIAEVPYPGVRATKRAAERAAIEAALAACGGNKTLAAARLGISRRSLFYKLKAYWMG